MGVLVSGWRRIFPEHQGKEGQKDIMEDGWVQIGCRTTKESSN